MPEELLAAVAEFVARIDTLDPEAPVVGELVIVRDGTQTRLTVREPVARAMAEALAAYRDPRDRGPCDHCGGRRVDDDFLCRDCGHPNGLFGQMIMERYGRHVPPAPLTEHDPAVPNVAPTS